MIVGFFRWRDATSLLLAATAASVLITSTAAPTVAAGSLPTNWYAAASTTTGSTFTPVAPIRLLDTRAGTGTGGLIAPLGPGGVLRLKVGGVDGVPTTVSAVVVNVTAVNPNTGSFLTVYPDGVTQPSTSNVDFASGQTTANMVVVPVPVSDGMIDFYNKNGSTDVVADLSGYYTPDAAGGTFSPMSPIRLLDTRNGTGGVPVAPLSPGGVLRLQVAGVLGVPSNATAVVLNLTATDATAASFLTTYADGSTQPSTSSLDFTAGQTLANLVVVQLLDGKIDISNKFGRADVVADLFGYDSTGAGGTFTTVTPTRVLDTRNGTGTSGVIAPLGSAVLPVPVEASTSGVPASATAVVLHVTAVNPTAASFLTVYPDGGIQPDTSNVNFPVGQIVSNLVIVQVTNGTVDIWNHVGTVDVVADISGYYS